MLDSKRMVEISYSVAPNYQSRDFATFAARQLTDEIAFRLKLFDCLYTHTLAEHHSSQITFQ